MRSAPGPEHAHRVFLSCLLQQNPTLIVLAMVDYNPCGVEIFHNWKHGNLAGTVGMDGYGFEGAEPRKKTRCDIPHESAYALLRPVRRHCKGTR